MVALFGAVLALLTLTGFALPAAAVDSDPELVVFWGQGCPHCEAEWEFLTEIEAEFPDLEINGYEVRYNPANWDLFVSVMAERGLEPRAVPTTILGDRMWEGFDAAVGDEIRIAVAAALTATTDPETEVNDAIDVPIVGRVEIGNSSLLVATVLIALVDGVNPCSLWVLSILMALVLRTGSRRRLLAIGGTFLFITTLLYGLYMAGIYGFLSIAANLEWVRLAMAAIALGFGIINLKDYFWFRRGPSLTIPDERKPWLYQRMRSVAASNEALPAALAGTALLAVGVSVLETPCTAGYPLLWANLVAEQSVGLAETIPLFALYMAVFLFDELLVFGVAVFAMRAMKLEERAGRLLKLVGGVVMIALAATLVFAPEAMSSVTGALTVFGIAAAVIVIILTVDWVRSRAKRSRTRRGSTRRRHVRS
jgi:thiol-disulfide isomerase/thioredoxin